MKKLSDVPMTMLAHCTACKRFLLVYLPRMVCKGCRDGQA